MFHNNSGTAEKEAINSTDIELCAKCKKIQKQFNDSVWRKSMKRMMRAQLRTIDRSCSFLYVVFVYLISDHPDLLLNSSNLAQEEQPVSIRFSFRNFLLIFFLSQGQHQKYRQELAEKEALMKLPHFIIRCGIWASAKGLQNNKYWILKADRITHNKETRKNRENISSGTSPKQHLHAMDWRCSCDGKFQWI